MYLFAAVNFCSFYFDLIVVVYHVNLTNVLLAQSQWQVGIRSIRQLRKYLRQGGCTTCPFLSGVLVHLSV